MSGLYRRRQRDRQWPPRGPWNPDGLPGWYMEMLAGLSAGLTSWRADNQHDPGQRLDPRDDPRRPQGHVEERSIHAKR